MTTPMVKRSRLHDGLMEAIVEKQMSVDYWDVTERPDALVSGEQWQRMYTRYAWAAKQSENLDVLEVACGAGQGLKLLQSVAKSVKAGDHSTRLLEVARATYGSSIDLRQLDAQALPYEAASFDVLLIAEAIYYLPDVHAFLSEASRVLRPGGRILIVTANKDLYDFHKSPGSHRYFGVVELRDLLKQHGFDAAFFGDISTSSVPWRQRLLRPMKAAAARLNLIPRTLAGRVWLKRLFFGQMKPMPRALSWDDGTYVPPRSLSPSEADRTHKVLLCSAQKLK